MTIPNIIKDARAAMDKDLAHIKHEFSSVRSANSSMRSSVHLLRVASINPL